MSAFTVTCPRCGRQYVAGVVGSTPWPEHVCPDDWELAGGDTRGDGEWDSTPTGGTGMSARAPERPLPAARPASKRDTNRLHVLAWSLPDMQPHPPGCMSRSGAIRGESPSAWALCQTCDGDGIVRDKFGRSQACTECTGAGRFRVDPFTAQRVQGIDSTAPPRGRRVPCDRCGTTGVMPGRWVGEEGLVRCEGCDGAGHLTVPVDTDSPRRVFLDGSPLGRARARGDWEALEAALGRLLGVSQASWRLFVRARVELPPVTEPERLAEFERWLLEQLPRLAEVERWLLEQLPRPLRCPADVVAAFEDRQKRHHDQLASRMKRVYQGQQRARRARELILQGYTQKDAAAVLGVDPSTVSRALRAA